MKDKINLHPGENFPIAAVILANNFTTGFLRNGYLGTEPILVNCEVNCMPKTSIY